MDKDAATREREYAQIMDLANQQSRERLPAIQPAHASFYFPWECSPARANGTTSTERSSGNQQ